MPYATQNDLIARYGAQEVAGISDYDATGEGDDAAVSTALADASVEMDAYIANSHALPLLKPYPSLLVRLCCELARYALYKDKASESVRTGREDAIALLRRIASGEAKLQLSPDTPIAETQGGSFAVSSSARVFSDAALARMFPAWN